MTTCTKVPLPELLSFVVDNRGKTVPTAESGHILIATNCIKNEHLYPVFEKIRYLSDETYQTWFRAHPEPGDVIFVNKGTPGRVCMVPDPVGFCIAQDMIAFRAKKSKLYNKYLLAVLRSPEMQAQIHNYNVGDVIPHFKKSFLGELLIPLPSMEIQREIGDIYFDLSDKIALNTKINHHLEQMAQAIWTERFGNREPNGILGDIIELFDSRRVPLSGNQRANMEKIYPYYGAASLMDYVDDYLFDGIYLLLGEDGTVINDLGFPVLQYVRGKFWVNNHAHILQGRNGFTVESLYTLLKQTNVASIVTGAVQLKINQANLKSLEVVIPSREEIEAFNALIVPLFAKIRNNSNENLSLAKTRDTLLPRLMSGELSVAGLAAK